MSDRATRRIRMGMVGGGLGSFIGPVHRMGAELDGEIELVAGAFSSNAEKSRESGGFYGIDSERAYASCEEMIDQERRRQDPIDFVAVVTPNHLHFPAAAAALEHGFHVMSDKPATARLDEALRLAELVDKSGLLYALTYTYTGYPMVREARRMVRAGEIGEIRKVVVNYPQGSHADLANAPASRRAAWRMDPARSGPGGAISDIGVHALNLVEYVGGVPIAEICAALSSLDHRPLDEDCNVLLQLENGAPGLLSVSKIATGERNSISLDLYGEKGGLHWSHNIPDRLEIGWIDRPDEIRHAAARYLAPGTLHASRMPAGHPEGVIEAFGNIYRDFAAAVRARLTDPKARLSEEVPGIEDGVRGMAFVERSIENSRARSGWTKLDTKLETGKR